MPGQYHLPLIHNAKIDPLAAEHQITSQVVEEFQGWQ
jgi:hypothetical protein